MVDREAVIRWCWASCQAMVSGPASNPTVASFSRSSTISSTVAASSEVGLVLGRLDRGSNAASPSAS
jgi:hypothetical protein